MNNKKHNKRNKRFSMITLGLLLIAAALFLSVYNLYDELRAERAANEIMNELDACFPGAPSPAEQEKTIAQAPAVPSDQEESTAQTPAASSDQEESTAQASWEDTGETIIPDYLLDPNMEMPVETINGIDFIGVLRIPALELELPIISQWSYSNLKTAPCRYSGSAYLDDLIICGHNYSSHFGNLKALQEGDIASFTDMDGNVFSYVVVEQQTLPPDATEAMESGDWDLTLFTCTVGGQNRVTIRFELEQ